MQRTSALDVESYRSFCYSASRYSEVFQNFKRHPVCQRAFEYVPGEFGKNSLIKILNNENFKLSVDQWKNFLQNDAVGNPVTSTYNLPNVFQMICSPTTLRYIKVLSDIVTYFDTSKIKTIAEIGVGYGGLCRIVKSFLQIDTYNLIDLPETLMLAERFLNLFYPPEISGGGGIRFFDGTHLYYDVEADFFISSFAFSELQKPVQDMYIEKVVSKSKAGYINWDGEFSKMAFGTEGYSLEEFLEKVPSPKVLPEDPVSTSKDNRIIMWGTK